jgi:nitric oxide reductase subunit B
MTKNRFDTDTTALNFLQLAMLYLIVGVVLGSFGGLQYLLPEFLKEPLAFQKTRPLHVYLVISWIFTAAQGGIYYYLPRISQRDIYWKTGIKLHLLLQASTSFFIVVSFFTGMFGGREYLEFPPALGLLIILSWLPFAINFFATLKPNYAKAPVYIWSWSTGIIFFFITLSESYLWLFDYFRSNIVRDTIVQWKAMGSMVGSWNMLIYGTGMYVMEKVSGDETICKKPLSYFFYFLGLTNLMFNWGHHTYIVPAAPWVKTVAYVISMTELLILGHIIWQFNKSLSTATRNYNNIVFRFLSFADLWIFLNLILSIIISVPAINYYTHGTHITVAHAMGATIGINTLILFASVFYILKEERQGTGLAAEEKLTGYGMHITNISLLIFWISLIGSGFVRMASKTSHKGFYEIMQMSRPWFKAFSFSGILLMMGLAVIILAAFRTLLKE